MLFRSTLVASLGPKARAAPAREAAEAKKAVAGFIDAIGFDALDAGPLREGWRFQRDMPAYNIFLDVAGLQAALGQAQRPSGR